MVPQLSRAVYIARKFYVVSDADRAWAGRQLDQRRCPQRDIGNHKGLVRSAPEQMRSRDPPACDAFHADRCCVVRRLIVYLHGVVLDDRADNTNAAGVDKVDATLGAGRFASAVDEARRTGFLAETAVAVRDPDLAVSRWLTVEIARED